MRNLILCIAGHSALANTEGEKKSEERKVKTKKALAALAVGHLLQPSPQVLSAAPSGVKDGRGQQCTTECSSSTFAAKQE